jgi:hypothetical protein
VDAVSVAAASEAVPLEVFNLWELAGINLGEVAFQAIRNIRARLRAPVFSFVGGGLPLVFGMIVHPRRPYDFILPAQPELPLAHGTELVPYEAVYVSMQTTLRPFFDVMDEIRNVSGGPVFHLESPPPCEEENRDADRVGWKAFHSEDDVIAPGWVRYKVWRLHSEIFSAHCNAAGITFVPHPPEVTDARGFLRPVFRGKPGHGNAEYGARVLKQMQALAAL